MLEKLQEALQQAGQTDSKSLSFICQALVRHNQKGFDYLELKLALHAMQGMDMTGEMALRSVLATASAMGVDSDSIHQSLDRYIKLLEQERVDFDKALTDAMARKVESRKEEIKQLEHHLSRLEAEMQRIEQGMQLAREKIVQHQSALVEAQSELADAEALFTSTFQVVIHEMERDRQRLAEIGRH
jgi:chromosome segregation ATPase